MRSVVILEDKRARLGCQIASAACRMSHYCEGPEATHVVGAGSGVVQCYPSLSTGEQEPTVMTFCSLPISYVKPNTHAKHLGECYLTVVPVLP